MDHEELQADIKWADNLAGGAGNHGAMNRIMDAARIWANPNRERMKLALHMLSVTKPDPDTAIDRLLAAAFTPQGDTKCPTCDGSGEMVTDWKPENGIGWTKATCVICGGTGAFTPQGATDE